MVKGAPRHGGPQRRGKTMQSFDQIPPPSGDQNESPEVQPQSFTPEPPPSEGKKVILLLVVLAVLIAGAGVFAYKMLTSKKPLLAPSVVSVGDPRDKVIRILGKPKGSTVRDNTELLIYDNGHVEIADGLVTVVAVGQGAQRGEIRQSNNKKNIILLDGGRIQTRSENAAGGADADGKK
jgi:hypothetical protein